MKIALITPLYKEDYLTNTVIDGLSALKGDGAGNEIRYSSDYKSYLDITSWYAEKDDFISFAKSADVIIFCNGKGNTDYDTAEKIGRWDKTVFVDGSELGRNRRYDMDIRNKVIKGTYDGEGAIDKEMLARCKSYFRREKPYMGGIIPLPFGIERRYISNYDPHTKKDIDIVCVFGQEEYPNLRREVRKLVENANGLRTVTKNTNGSLFSRMMGLAPKDNGRVKFYDLLSRAKVGVSVGGGGYDTARFWEILGNNCILLTEKLDIYEPGSRALDYERIWQFGNLEEFESQLDKLSNFLKSDYKTSNMSEEYVRILREHSTKARVLTILDSMA
ncbi:MAG: glycosyltransferase [Candidatus Paceibacterota bacterium]|jgi:hypothetical protein